MARILIGRVLSSLTDSVKTILRAGAKGATAEADITSSPIDSDHQALDVKVLGPVGQSLAATRTIIPATTTETLLLPVDPTRKWVHIYNNSDSILYVGFGSTPVTANNFTMMVNAQDDMDLPIMFAGEIRGLWLSSTGEVYLTVMT